MDRFHQFVTLALTVLCGCCGWLCLRLQRMPDESDDQWFRNRMWAWFFAVALIALQTVAMVTNLQLAARAKTATKEVR